MFNILNLDWMVITIWTKHKKKVPTFESRVSFCFKVGQLAIPRILFEKNDSDVLQQIFLQGYVLMNDWSARDIQARKKKRKRRRRNTKHHKITRWLWFSNFGLPRSTYLGKPNLKSTYQGPQASTVYPFQITDKQLCKAWEYVPLGPFGAKNFGTTISPWVVALTQIQFKSDGATGGCVRHHQALSD